MDFYIAEAKLVIELDGSQHFEVEGQRTDAQRDAYLQALGLTVLRYANSDVNRNFNGVCEDIWNRLKLSEKSPLLEERVPRRGGCGVAAKRR